MVRSYFYVYILSASFVLLTCSPAVRIALPEITQAVITAYSLTTLNASIFYSLNEADLNLFKSTINGMDNLMTYINQPRPYVIDLLFGFIIGRGQLSVLSRHLSMNPWYEQSPLQEYLWKWINECDQLYNGSSPIIKNDIANALFWKVIKPDLWEVNKSITAGLLREPTGHWSKGSRYWLSKPITELKHNGSPKENESDKCIVEITQCKFSSTCWNMMTKNDNATGYAVTHRLLYFQVARQLNCLNKKMLLDVEDRIVNFCSNIYQEAKNLYKLGPPSQLRDLFIEQIVLCGIEGFAEFLYPKWLKKMLTWQTSQGCFSEKLQKTKLVKRSDLPLGADCMMHITGLSAAALPLFLRGILE